MSNGCVHFVSRTGVDGSLRLQKSRVPESSIIRDVTVCTWLTIRKTYVINSKRSLVKRGAKGL